MEREEKKGMFDDCKMLTELPENAVVVMPDKLDEYQKAELQIIKDQARKETVRDILQKLKSKQVICSLEEDNFVYMLDIEELAKQCGVEVKE